MTISELIKKLELIKAHSGDIEVAIRGERKGLLWPPELLVISDEEDILILNS